MKVRALVTGTHYIIDEHTQRPALGLYNQRAEVRHREGDVFTLVPYLITEVDPHTSRILFDENGKVKMRLHTIDEQFNPKTMERMEEDAEESYSTAQEALDRQTEALRVGRATKRPPSKIAEARS